MYIYTCMYMLLTCDSARAQELRGAWWECAHNSRFEEQQWMMIDQTWKTEKTVSSVWVTTVYIPWYSKWSHFSHYQSSLCKFCTHARGDHWIAVSTVNCTTEDITVYDSKYSRLSPDTETLIAQLVNTNKPVVSVNIANLTKQSSSADCGLFAIAYITHIAFGLNPCVHVFQQSSMREHFLKCLENKKMEPKRRGDCPSHIKWSEYKYTAIAVVLIKGKRWLHVMVIVENGIMLDVSNLLFFRNKKWYCENCSLTE